MSGPMKTKPKIRRKTKSPPKGNGAMSAANDIEQELDELEPSFSVRVRERGPDSPPEGRPRSRLGALLRDPSPANIKETIKRPLSGLLKRPGSRSGSKDRSKNRENGGGGQRRGDEDDNATLADFNMEEDTKKSPKKKSGFFDGKRPGTAFGRKFSFGRGGKNKEEQSDIEEQLRERKRGDEMIELDSGPVGNDRDSDSPDIPNLEEVEGAAFGTQVAQAPSVAVNRVSTYRELDSELMKQSAFTTLGDIDLSLLTRFLCPDAEIRDEAVPWSWDYLYTGICSELRSEWEEAEDEDEEQPPAYEQIVNT